MSNKNEETLLFISINNKARKKLNLTMNEYCLCDMIYHLSNNPKYNWCVMSKERMANELNLSKQSIHSLIKKMIEKGLLEKDNETNFLRTTQLWYDNVIIDKKDEQSNNFTDGKESGLNSKESLLDSKESLHNNNRYIYKDNNNYFSDEKLNNSFLDFINNRKELKIKMTDLAIDRMVNKIKKWQDKYTNAEIISFIDESIANSRRGLFELKIDKNEKKERTEAEKKEMFKFAEQITKMGNNNKKTRADDLFF